MLALLTQAVKYFFVIFPTQNPSLSFTRQQNNMLRFRGYIDSILYIPDLIHVDYRSVAKSLSPTNLT